MGLTRTNIACLSGGVFLVEFAVCSHHTLNPTSIPTSVSTARLCIAYTRIHVSITSADFLFKGNTELFLPIVAFRYM